MKFAFLFFLLLPIAGQTYVAWRTWQLLPELVIVSDLHLGYHDTRTDLHRWLTLQRAEHPDAILIGGDHIDGCYRPVAQEHIELLTEKSL